MVKRPGVSVRGSKTGRPIMVLLDIMGERWTLRILWELSSGRATFRALQSRCNDVSPTLLNKRLKNLRNMALVDLTENGYGLTDHGAGLTRKLALLDNWAVEWANFLNGTNEEGV